MCTVYLILSVLEDYWVVVDRPGEELREGEDDLKWPGGGAETGRNEAKKDSGSS